LYTRRLYVSLKIFMRLKTGSLDAQYRYLGDDTQVYAQYIILRTQTFDDFTLLV